MKTQRSNASRVVSTASLLMLAINGCQGGLTGIPSLNSLNNPTRVPPPAAGSFQVPAKYSDSSSSENSAARPGSTTLGQLRSIETGKPAGDMIGSDGLVASNITNGSFTSKPLVAEAVSTPQAAANPAVIHASALQELPDPRFDNASHGTLNSTSDIQWKPPQR